MCTTCGCSDGNAGIEDHEQRDDGHSHAPAQMRFAPVARSPLHVHADGTMHYGNGPAHAHAPGMSRARMVKIEQDILAKNNGYAGENRQYFAEHGVFALNLVSSPGSGKTTLLAKTIALLGNEVAIAVIEGDQQTSNDAERIRAAGARALQINTGRGCHLDAHMVGHALQHLLPADDSLLMIENVGNLVCPAMFDLGEAHKVAVLSVTEGEDKPLKYPDIFQACDLMLLNKCDLLPCLQFDVDACIENALRIKTALSAFDAEARFGIAYRSVPDAKACECGAILRGVKKPADCKVFGTVCTPENPVGSCMVSSEGACAAHYSYGRFAEAEITETSA